MKLAVSNLAWEGPEEAGMLELLAGLSVEGIEVAPTKWWPGWAGADSPAASVRRSQLSARGFSIPALQSVLYGRSDLQVFGSREVQDATVTHLARVAELADSLGARVLVFGSPQNRVRGELPREAAMDRAGEFFRRVGDACRPWNVEFCIEPNPEVYHCDFLTHWHEVLQMVQSVGHPHVGIHLDAACIALAGDDPADAIRDCAGQIRHFHVTEPQLGGFADPKLDHATIGAALAETGYDRWVSIEMRRSADPQRSVAEAVQRVRSWYR